MNYNDAKELFNSLNEEVNKIRLISNPTNFQNDPAFSKLIYLREEVRKLLEIVPAHRVKAKVFAVPTLNANGKINEEEIVNERAIMDPKCTNPETGDSPWYSHMGRCLDANMKVKEKSEKEIFDAFASTMKIVRQKPIEIEDNMYKVTVKGMYEGESIHTEGVFDRHGGKNIITLPDDAQMNMGYMFTSASRKGPWKFGGKNEMGPITLKTVDHAFGRSKTKKSYIKTRGLSNESRIPFKVIEHSGEGLPPHEHPHSSEEGNFIEFKKMADQHLARAGKGELTQAVYDQAVEDVGGFEGNLAPLLARVKELTENYKVGENMEHPKSRMIEQLMPLFEQDLDQAELVLAAKDMGDRLQKMAEDLASMQVEDLMPLVAAMKEQMGPEKAGAFESSADAAISGALDSVKSAKESHDNAVLALQGEAPPETDMDMEEPSPEDMGDVEMDIEEPSPEMEIGDEEAMAGPEGEPEGREIKAEESVQFLNKAKNILRAYKTIGKLDETALAEAQAVLEGQSKAQKEAFQKMLDAKKNKKKGK